MGNVLIVNGVEHRLNVSGDTPLLWALRDEIGLTGTKFGCGAGLCGACTVHVDEQPVRACQVSLADLEGQSVTTIEGVEGRIATALMEAWKELDTVQCGYCQPGQIMQAVGLLTDNSRPSDADIDRAMNGNICRCSTYPRIRRAIVLAAQNLETSE